MVKKLTTEPQRGIIDSEGCLRYTLSFSDLKELYIRMEDFIADCTQEEYKSNEAAIIAIYTLLHKHMNMNI